MSTNGSYDQQAGTRDCYSTGCIPLRTVTDVDVDGITVTVTSVVVNICLRVLLMWSPADIDAGVWASLNQIYPILLSALASINREQLSRFDVNFALALCSSPFTVYLVALSICNICRVKTDLYERIKSHRFLISLFGALVAILWFGLSLTLGLSDHAFIDTREVYKRSTSKDWFHDFLRLCLKVLSPGRLYPFYGFFIVAPFLLLLLRRWCQVKNEFLTSLEGSPKLWGWFTAPLRFVKCAWCVVEREHEWYKVLLFVYLDVSWATEVIMIAVSTIGKKYVLSYGQVLFVFPAVLPVVSTAKLVYSCRWDLLRFLKRFPTLFLAEMKYIATGREPTSLTRENILPLTRLVSSQSQESPHEPPPEAQPRQHQGSTAGLLNDVSPVCSCSKRTGNMNANAPSSSATQERGTSTSITVSTAVQRSWTVPMTTSVMKTFA